VAEVVVDPFEVVDIQHDQRHVALRQAGCGLVDHGGAVQSAAQRVVRGAVFQLLRQFVQLAVHLVHIQLGAVAAADQAPALAHQAFVVDDHLGQRGAGVGARVRVRGFGVGQRRALQREQVGIGPGMHQPLTA
jgi:hypothetical protein